MRVYGSTNTPEQSLPSCTASITVTASGDSTPQPQQPPAAPGATSPG